MKNHLISLVCVLLFADFAAAQNEVRGHQIALPPFPTRVIEVMPPQQQAVWNPKTPDELASVSQSLFSMGLADPRGCQYRDIEIAVGNPWDGGGGKMQTRGWVLPAVEDQPRFAVAWSGLIYPLLSVGAPQDFRADAAAQMQQAQTGELPRIRDNSLRFRSPAESGAVDFKFPHLVSSLLLARLGEDELAHQLLKTFQSPNGLTDATLFLAAARQWTGAAFERAVCAHERGDDVLALFDAQLLTKAQPQIDAEAKRRNLPHEPTGMTSRDSDNEQSYLNFLGQLPALLTDSERRLREAQTPAPQVNGVAALIFDLQNVNEHQSGQPGGVSLASDARVQALVKRGDETVEPLIAAIETDDRLTRSVSFHRDFFAQRQVLSVRSAAYAALTDLLHFNFNPYGEDGQVLTRPQVAVEMRAYWQKMKAMPPEERWYATLRDDKAGKDAWLQMIANIAQPTDVEAHGGWVSIPQRTPGQKIALRGERLRDNRSPSVAQLGELRSDEVAASNTHSTDDLWAVESACNLALYLSAWDAKAAVPALQRRSSRCIRATTDAEDPFAFHGSVLNEFFPLISKMTLARVRGGDTAAYNDYAAWIQKVDLKEANFAAEELQKPLITGAANPGIAGATDYVFNDPRSAWSDLFGARNGFWISDFWESPLCLSEGFKRNARRVLGVRRTLGTVYLNPPELIDSRGELMIAIASSNMGTGRLKPDPLKPPPNRRSSFRACDFYAWQYAQHQGGPRCELYWPQKNRDAAVQKCLKWLDSQKMSDAKNSHR